jgi:hypothetical protein
VCKIVKQIRKKTNNRKKKIKVQGSLHFTVPSIKRLNQTEPATFSNLPVGLSLGILIFSI